MSGEAGSSIQSEYYHIQYTSGVSVSVAEPPWIEGEDRNQDYTAEYFESENKHYIDKLNKVKPALDKLFHEIVATKEIPLFKYDSEAFFFFGVIIEDMQDIEPSSEDDEQIETWLKDQTQPKMDLNWSFYDDRFETINISITVNQRVLRSKIKIIQSAVQEIFNAD